uniref:uncharacterized protein LOC105349486 n=1 Tax=Fragaria vesca subsp. vesca TaxID=101020 RepID=UPI0005CA9DF1|nr:PREDICTED: uncharacterized protein LOC105349486 [Fragaria vesca subsp. vesca]
MSLLIPSLLEMDQDKVSKAPLFRGKSNGEGLYLFRSPKLTSSCPSAFVSTVKCTIWHHRLGHPTDEVVSKMLSLSNVKSKSDNKPHVCVSCLTGKMHKLPFSESVSRTTVPF